jgi:ferredoxin
VSVIITRQCITCGACEWECPNEAIAPGSVRPVVDENVCTECYGFFGESQCIVVCPASAIRVHPEPIEVISQRFTRLHPLHDPQDTWIWQRIGNDALPSDQP